MTRKRCCARRLWLSSRWPSAYFVGREFRSSDVGTLWPSRNAFVARAVAVRHDAGADGHRRHGRRMATTGSTSSRPITTPGRVSGWPMARADIATCCRPGVSTRTWTFRASRSRRASRKIGRPASTSTGRGGTPNSQFTLVIRTHRIKEVGPAWKERFAPTRRYTGTRAPHLRFSAPESVPQAADGTMPREPR